MSYLLFLWVSHITWNMTKPMASLQKANLIQETFPKWPFFFMLWKNGEVFFSVKWLWNLFFTLHIHIWITSTLLVCTNSQRCSPQHFRLWSRSPPSRSSDLAQFDGWYVDLLMFPAKGGPCFEGVGWFTVTLLVNRWLVCWMLVWRSSAFWGSWCLDWSLVH